MNYLQITHEDICNGDGLRVVLWLSGCSHHCYNCQNPQTWNPDSGILFDESAKQEILDELSKDYISGLTLTGGDPLQENNLDGVLSLVKEITEKFPKKTIWLYTGYSYSDIYRKRAYLLHEERNHNKRRHIIDLADVLVDGKYMDEYRDVTLKWRGSSNQRVIDVKSTKQNGKIVLYCE